MADLNVNSISNAAETGAPDFSHMPTVAGDPVVESGSNSDGSWTRWADGTQHCYAYLSTSTTWSLPTLFIGPSTTFSCVATVRGQQAAGRYIDVSPDMASDVASVTITIRDTANNLANQSKSAFAAGRWK